MHLRAAFSRFGAIGVAACLVCGGCVKREIEITSTPGGAQVLLNGREVGRTPTRVEFTFDGTYEVRLRLNGYDPVIGSGDTKAPVWDFIGADLVAEVFPADLHRVEQWHFELVPEAQAEAGLHERAAALRQTVEQQPAVVEGAPAPAAGPATAPAASSGGGKASKPNKGS